MFLTKYKTKSTIMEKSIIEFNHRGNSHVLTTFNCWQEAKKQLGNTKSTGVLIKYDVNGNKVVAMINKAKNRIVASSWCNGVRVRIYPDIQLEHVIPVLKGDVASLIVCIR